jgi:amino acid transporter
MPIVLIPLLKGLGIPLNNDSPTQITIALIILASTTLLNIFGVRLVAIVNNTGVVFEILGMVVFAIILLIFYRHQSPAVVFDTSALGSGFTNQAGTFAIAMFMSLFVIFGFDTAATLAEETKNPRKEAPRAILLAIAGAAVIGAIFLFATLLAIPGDIHKYVAGAATTPATSAPPVDIITGNLPGWAATLYLLVVAAAIYVCCLAIQTATVRLAFGMARDGKLPFGRLYNNVSPSLHTPVGTSIVIAVLAAIPFLYYSGVAIIAIAATGMIYISYLLGNFAVLRARLRGWPKENTPFKLGSWGMLINVLALVWGGAMLVNFLWPRAATNPPLSALPGWGLGDTLGSIPIFEATLGVILIVGAIYYFAALRNSSETPTILPAGETVPA